MKILCSMVVSVDGFIADKDGKTVSEPPDWEVFYSLAKKYNNFVVGRKTYDIGGLESVECDNKVVVSSKPAGDLSHASSPQDAIEKLKGKVDTVFLVGGAQLNSSFAEQGLIDELDVLVVPKVVGSGLKLFNKDVKLDLELVSTQKMGNDRVKLSYKIP